MIGGIEFVDLPGGLFVLGGTGREEPAPQWYKVDPCCISKTPVTVEQFVATTGAVRTIGGGEHRRFLDDLDRKGHPAVSISSQDAEQFFKAFNKKNGTNVRAPTMQKWEYAARGEVVFLRDRMEAEGVRPGDFVEWGTPLFENFFADTLGSAIYTDPRRDDFQKILRSAARIYGYSVYGHPEGLNGEKINWHHSLIAPNLLRNDRASVTDDAARTRANSFGLIDMIGNVFEIVEDGLTYRGRGGSWATDDDRHLRVARQGFHDCEGRSLDQGFRLVEYRRWGRQRK
jgi:formylglycine-generating enzyme required for sulfatase activity